MYLAAVAYRAGTARDRRAWLNDFDGIDGEWGHRKMAYADATTIPGTEREAGSPARSPNQTVRSLVRRRYLELMRNELQNRY